jgi:hypothetical protein
VSPHPVGSSAQLQARITELEEEAASAASQQELLGRVFDEVSDLPAGLRTAIQDALKG